MVAWFDIGGALRKLLVVGVKDKLSDTLLCDDVNVFFLSSFGTSIARVDAMAKMKMR